MEKCINWIKKQLRRARNCILFICENYIFSVYVRTVRRIHRWKRNRRLKNEKFTIISNNCAGGIIYHELNHKFMSPTINLWFSDNDYFEFLNNLDFYTHTAPEEVFINGIDYPVGKIRRDEHEIIIYFMHYESFSEACKKWMERAPRINMNNLYVIFNQAEYVTHDSEWIRRFRELKYEHKVMLTNCEQEIVSHDIRHMPVYESLNHPGVIFEYKSSFSSCRWLDDFDYVSFLNQKNPL